MIGILGGILLTAAVFAVPLGLDNDAGWGKSRIFMAVFGLGLMASNWITVKYRKELIGIIQKIAGLDNTTKGRMYAAAAFLLVSAVYYWYALPAFENPDFRFDYYGRVAAAFRHGQVHLLEEPPQSLLSLSDPYNYTLRYETGVVDEIPIDITLYKEKYYLYWGPAPSLFLMPFSEERIAQIKDKYIGYLFACGVLLYLILFTLKLWERYGAILPAWFIGVFALTLGLSMPVPWMFRASGIYEAAIFGAQFFLIGGFYWLYLSLGDKKISTGKLLLGGMHWAFAMGTRLTAWVPILLGAFVTLIYLLKDLRQTPIKQTIFKPILFAIPPFIALLLLGWYNYARFDSVTDFGLNYQLANTDYRTFRSPFAAFYIPGNLHNYFTFPITVVEKFPFIKPTENTSSNERLAGMLYTTPWILFFLVPLSRLMSVFLKKRNCAVLSPLEAWFLFSVGGGAAVMLLLILMFYFPATRYAEDFTPLFLLFTFFLIARDTSFNRGGFSQKFYIGIFTALGLWTIAASLLLSMPVEHVVKIMKLSLRIRSLFLGFGIGG